MQSEKPTESNLEMLQINDLKSNCEELEKKMHTDAEKIIKNFYQSIQMANKPDDSSKIKYMNEFLTDLSKYIETNSAISVLKENKIFWKNYIMRRKMTMCLKMIIKAWILFLRKTLI